MVPVEECEQLRRAYFLENKGIRQLARDTGHSRQVIRKILFANHPARTSSLPPQRRSAPIFGPFQVLVEQLLVQNDRLPRKQRFTSRKIFELLQAEGYQGCESRVRQHMAAWRQAHHPPALFLPLEFEPGQDAQVDWGEAVAVIGGVRQIVQVFLMRLCFSRRTFVLAFPTQRQESFFYGHVQAFRHFGGIPHRISYDNLATAVKIAFERTEKRKRSRHEVRGFTAFRSHYLFESHFCTPGEEGAHEKGGVESTVGYARRQLFVPLPEADSFETLNQQLLARCLKEDGRRVARQASTIGEAWELERAHLLPLPPSDYECCEMVTVRLTPYSQATYETNRYSVPVHGARREVTLKAYPFSVEIWDGLQLLANHPRCYAREQDIFNPLHYLPLLEQRPGAFDYAKPLKAWRKEWPDSYHRVLADLRQKWPEGRGVQEFVRILQLHQHYPASLLEQAIEQALAYGCVHLDGVLYCLHQVTDATASRQAPMKSSPDLAHRPDLETVGTPPINLAQYEQLLKQSW